MKKPMILGAAPVIALLFMIARDAWTPAGALIALVSQPAASSSGGPLPQSQKTVWDRVFSEEQAKRGEALYQKSCALCHRNDLTGTASDGPPLKGLDFFIRWRGQTVAEMLDAVREIMPSNDPGSLKRQTYLDIMSFLFKSNGVPMGDTDLPPDPDTLQQVMITEKPPVLNSSAVRVYRGYRAPWR